MKWLAETASSIVTVVLAFALGTTSVAGAQGQPVKSAIESQSFVANLYLPVCPAKCPVVLLAGGSGGGIGWQDYMGDVLARNGFAALALAYFRMPGLPDELDQIPLEYFQGALAYVRSHPSLNADRVGIAGTSKGGELALLLAAHEPGLRAVVAFVPSSVVWQSLPSEAAWKGAAGFPRRSSWTFKGQPLAFVPYAAGLPNDSLADMYRRSLAQSELVDRAAIPVEKINGPVLLLSGKQDTTWPSTEMAEMVIRRLREHRFPFAYDHIAYDDAGHQISVRSATNLKGVPTTRRGGTEKGNQLAQDDAERRMLEFFGRSLAEVRRK